ncbi:MAG: porin, partial [Massilia sp.]|nr:porin [Massilia sp.]
MKKSVLSLAVLAALAAGGAAHAQSNVQVYGLIDAGVESLNHASASQGSVVKVISGGK